MDENTNTWYSQDGDKKENENITPVTRNPYSLGAESDEDSLAERLYAEKDRVELTDDTDLSEFANNEHELSNLKKDLGYMASALGADAESMKTLLDISREYSSPVNDKDAHKAKIETEKLLREELGTGWQNDLKAAKELVQSFPEMRKGFNNSGMGNDARVIRELIRLAKTPRGSNRVAQYSKRKAV